MKKLLFTVALLLTFGVVANAQIIGATNSKTTSNPRQSSDSPLYRPTGGSLRFSTGLPGILTVSYNHYFTPGFMLGSGLGFGLQEEKIDHYSHYNYEDGFAMPVFLEMDLRTPKYKWSLFLNLKVGINLSGGEDKEFYNNNVVTVVHERNKVLLFTAAVGISYKNINLGFGYGNQHIVYFGPINFFLSYNLPLTTINKWLF